MKIDLCLACNHTIEIAPDLIFFLKEQQTLLNVLFYFLQKEIKLLHQMSTGSLADFLHRNCNTFSPSDILLMWKPQEWEQNKKEGYNFATIVPVGIVAVNLQFNKSDHIASLHDQIALMRLSLQFLPKTKVTLNQIRQCDITWIPCCRVTNVKRDLHEKFKMVSSFLQNFCVIPMISQKMKMGQTFIRCPGTKLANFIFYEVCMSCSKRKLFRKKVFHHVRIRKKQPGWPLVD